jgi:ornithine carbamoyltransferase
MLNKRSLLNISDLSKKDILQILNFANDLKDKNSSDLKGKSIGMIFEKYSTRTRLSFQVGISQLGGNAIDIRFEDLNLQRVESFEDTFKILSLYLDAIVFRTTDHSKLINASIAFNKPIINGLSDLSHPCQIISDLFTIKEHFQTLDNLSISWFGDMNNVLFSYFEILEIFPDIKLNVFTNRDIYEKKVSIFPISKNINFYFDLNSEVIKNSHCIMTDVFTSMNDPDDKKEKLLEQFQVNKNLMDITKPDCIFMHCLPANVGVEVTREILDSNKSVVIKQAKNRLIAQKGIMKWLNI